MKKIKLFTLAAAYEVGHPRGPDSTFFVFRGRPGYGTAEMWSDMVLAYRYYRRNQGVGADTARALVITGFARYIESGRTGHGRI